MYIRNPPRKDPTMPVGESKSRPIRWPSAEYLAAYDKVCARLDTNSAARLLAHAQADIDLHGTPEEQDLAREHRAGRPAPGPKKQASPAGSPAEELKTWGARRDEGLITNEEFEAKKKQLLGL